MQIDRVIDANANRAAEGLRIIEEVARFVLDDAALSARAKTIRHALRQAIPANSIAARDTAGDVGTAVKAADEQVRGDLVACVRANAARVTEALRVLDEFAKLPSMALNAAIEPLRYQVYDLECDVLARLPQARWQAAKLYVLVDAALCANPVAVAEAAVRGGAQAIQLRAKALTKRAYAELAERMRDAMTDAVNTCADASALFVVNDHVDVAAWLQADAVHCGQDDLPLAAVRRVVGPLMAIGMSTHSVEQVVQAQQDGATYLGIGPMYATATKPHEPERGVELLAAASPSLAVPSYAIGGLNAERIAQLKSTLPHGVAVAGAVCQADDPQRVCAELRELLDG